MLAPFRARRSLPWPQSLLRLPITGLTTNNVVINQRRTLLHLRSYVSEPLQTPIAKPPHRSRILRRAFTLLRFSGYFLLSSAFGILAIGGGIFIHDAFTYTDKHLDRVPVSPLALHPELGGPKNLPVVRVQVDDEEDEENIKLAEKPRLVIVGGGWGVSGGFVSPFMTVESLNESFDHRRLSVSFNRYILVNIT